MERIKIGLFVIATNRYKQFIDQLLKSVDQYFFPDNKVNVYLFVDDISHKVIPLSPRINVQLFKIESLIFPYATLYRYHIFSQVSTHVNCDYVFYSDVDMRFVGFVKEEILPDMVCDDGLVCVGHCGFWNGGGSWEENIKSKAYVPKELHKRYYAGGFQGGKTKSYLDACSVMSKDIQSDMDNEIIPVWHDESVWNKYLSTRSPKILTPDYCMVEQLKLRELWGVNNFEPKIIALNKNHTSIRL